MIVAAAKRRRGLAEHAQRCPVERISDNANRTRVPMKIGSRHLKDGTTSLPGRAVRPKSMVAEATPRAQDRKRPGREQDRRDAARLKADPLPQAASRRRPSTPTGEKCHKPPEIMAAAIPTSMIAAVVGEHAERTMLAVTDEADLGNGRSSETSGCTTSLERSAKMPMP